jgi:anaphase-promoting complex subunit 2
VDPSGVLFEMVSPVIKQYLRSRKDTIRCIVTSLTEDTESELFAELMIRKAPAMPTGRWYPDPIDVDAADGTHQSDLISTLIGVYGSKEVFVNEYRSLLSEKLLAKRDFDTEQCVGFEY